MSLIPSASSTTSRGVPSARASEAFELRAEVDRVGVPERSREQHGQHGGDLGGVLVDARAGAQLVVPGIRPSTWSCGRALRRVRSRIASPTATPMPCSTPTRATVSSVTTASANSKRSNRAIATRSRRWKIRVATKMSTPASVASGTSLSSPAAGIERQQRRRRAEARRAGVRPDAEATAAVLAGLAFTGKAPTRPADDVPGARRRRSRGRRRPRSGPGRRRRAWWRRTG